MANRITIPNRGMLEIKDSNIKCFLGNGNNYKSSEQLRNELKDKKLTTIKKYIKLGEEEYPIYYPIPEKKISIVANNGKSYKSTIYFIDDIKNIIIGLKMNNPCYIDKGKYITMNSDYHYSYFLYLEEGKEIKDVDANIIKFDKLENKFKSIVIKDTYILGDINNNINLYSKIDNIEKEEFFFTTSRTRLFTALILFYENKKRDLLSDLIYGIYGNYACGKSFFLIYFNYICEYPSVYLNLKTLKKAFETEGFQDLLNNELMFLFYKLKKSFNDFKAFVSKFLPFEKKKFENLIISIIDELSSESVLIILDQYQENNYSDFIINLKKILFSKKSKIKVILSSSMNDGPIREAYLDIILNRIQPKNENKNIIRNEERMNEEIKTEMEEEQKEEEQKEEEQNEEQKKKEKEERKKKENEIKEKENNDIKKDKDKIDNYIPYNFVSRLVSVEQIKENIIEINLENKEDIYSYLELFNFLPLYYSLCKQNIHNLNGFVEESRIKIKNKILEFNKGEKYNIKYFDDIRKMIDSEITKDELNYYSKYIPFKYFYIEQNEIKLILRTHFPLVKEVWEQIIMNETVNLISGNLKYDGNVIGSILELNIISNIKDKTISLDIDCFIKVDSIYDFGNIIEKDTDEFKNKNIFITQQNQNAPYFDIAYIKGKNIDAPILTFIQVKKGMTSNKIDKSQMYERFEERKNYFFKLFNFIPQKEDINLIYISLYNKEIQQVINEHDSYKKDKYQKVGNLDNKILKKYYSFSQLYSFCNKNDIQIYYYDIENHVFLVKENNSFITSDLNLSNKNQLKYLDYIFNTSYLTNQLKLNKENSNIINNEYSKFLQRKRKKPSDSFDYKIDEFNFGIVTEFAEKYFNNITIFHYIDLSKAHLNIEYKNLSNNQAIICLKIEQKKKYKVDSFIYRDNLIICKGENFESKKHAILDRDNDFLVAINFESISESLKKFLKNK